MRGKKMIFLLSIIIVVLLTFAALYLFWAPGKIVISQNYLAELNQLTKPKNYEPKLNAAPIYDAAFAMFKFDPDELEKLWKIKPSDMNELELQLARTIVSDNLQGILLLHDAAQMPYSWRERDDRIIVEIRASIPDLKRTRLSAHLLLLNSALIAYNGNMEDAFKNTINIYKIGGHYIDNTLLVEQLVGVAIQTLAVEQLFDFIYKYKPSHGLLADFRVKLRSFKTFDGITFITEKLFSEDYFQRMFTDNGKGSGTISAYRAHLEGFGWKRFDRAKNVSAGREILNFFETQSTKTPATLKRENFDLDTYLKRFNSDVSMVTKFCPAFQRIQIIGHRFRISKDALLTTCAILEHKGKTGQLPETLDILVSEGYINEVPIDPFSDEPLVYRITNDGNFILYSFGGNLKDDGGRHTKWDEDGDYVFWPVQYPENAD